MRFGFFVLIVVAAVLLASQPFGRVAGRADAADTVRVFIQLPDRFRTSDWAEVRGLGGEPRYAFLQQNTISVEIPSSLLPVLERSQRFRAFRPVPTVAIAEDFLPWGVDHINAERVWGAGAGNVTGEDALNVVEGAYDGSGVRIAIIDTGIAPHPDLNVTGRATFVDGESADTDGHGHGTHVAGTAAARDNPASSSGTSILGVAPGADLLAVKVLSAAGSGSMDDVAAGILWAAENGADVINMSLVCTGTSTACNDSVMQGALQDATDAGVVIVAAAGNAGAGTNTVGWPAQDPRTIAVAATTSSNARASFSSTGPAVDIAAPGVEIFSTYPGTYATMSGTSMASPHVAGAAALLVDCGYSASQTRSLLLSTADDLGTSGTDTYYGAGLLDIDGAMADCVATPPSGGGSTAGTITEDFESGGFSGGEGWSADWSRGGSSSYTTVTTSSGPQAGTRHVLVRANASLTRRFSLAAYDDVSLTFWAKGYSWESGDGASVQVSTNGTSWTTVATFADGFDTNVYQQRQVSLDQWAGQGTVYLRILGQMSASTDYLYVDSIYIGGTGGSSLEPTLTNTPVTPTQTQQPTQTPTQTQQPTQTPTQTQQPTQTPTQTQQPTQTPTQTPTPTNTPPSGGGTISEPFDSTSWSGGSGWAAAWSRAGSTSYTTLTTSSSPQAGSRHLQVRANASLSRRFSLSGYGSATLTFWAKGYSWEFGDGGSVQISTNGSTWTTIASFTNGFDTNVYQQRQVSLNSWAGQGTVYLRILGQMSASTDYFYVDSITISAGSGGSGSGDGGGDEGDQEIDNVPEPTPTFTATPPDDDRPWYCVYWPDNADCQ
jgi:hypothetical protein